MSSSVICIILQKLNIILLILIMFNASIMCKRQLELKKEELIDDTFSIEEIKAGDSIVISWEPPPDSIEVDKYDIFYRTVHDTQWNHITEVFTGKSNYQLTINRRDLPITDSIFLFGMRYMTIDSAFSEIFASSDSLSLYGGWFLLWEK